MAEADDGKKVDAFSLDAGVPKIEGSIRPKRRMPTAFPNESLVLRWRLLC